MYWCPTALTSVEYRCVEQNTILISRAQKLIYISNCVKERDKKNLYRIPDRPTQHEN